MDMRRAFNARMLRPVTLYTNDVGGSYDLDNNWVERTTSTPITVQARVTAGNKFSQFEEGIAAITEDGGRRTKDFISVYIKADVDLSVNMKLGWNGKYYNILQVSDEGHFGFRSFLAEKVERWTP